MAGELIHPAGTSGQTYQAVLRNAAGQVWRTDTSAFGTWSDAQIANYGIPLTEQGASGHFVGSFPAAIVTAGLYAYTVYQRAGASLALTDSKQGLGAVEWDGAAEVLPLSGPAQADALLDRADGIETGWTVRQVLRVLAAILAGKVSGAGTGTEVFRSITDAKARATAVVTDAGDRSSVTLDAT